MEPKEKRSLARKSLFFLNFFFLAWFALALLGFCEGATLPKTFLSLYLSCTYRVATTAPRKQSVIVKGNNSYYPRRARSISCWKRLIFSNSSHEQISFTVVWISWNLLPRKLSTFPASRIGLGMYIRLKLQLHNFNSFNCSLVCVQRQIDECILCLRIEMANFSCSLLNLCRKINILTIFKKVRRVKYLLKTCTQQRFEFNLNNRKIYLTEFMQASSLFRNDLAINFWPNFPPETWNWQSIEHFLENRKW